MTKQEEEVGTALASLVARVVNEALEGQPSPVLAGARCEVFADAEGNVWARGEDGALIGRVRLLVLPCPV